MYGKDKGIPWHTTFLGVRQQHNYWLYKMLDDVIARSPHIGSIVEIGTGGGALTAVLGLHGLKLKIPVLSVDINQGRSLDLHDTLDAIKVKRVEIDEFSPVCFDIITKHIGYKPTLLFCDGGCKKKEVNLWAPRLPHGSIIGCHDWTVEVQPDDVKDLTNIIPVFESCWNENNVQTAWWITE